MLKAETPAERDSWIQVLVHETQGGVGLHTAFGDDKT